MNCAYHNQNVAVVNCNGCGKALCPACDHRIKGFPFCQDCIVAGVELLRNKHQSFYVPIVQKQTSPFIATILSLICPGLGAAYNGQTSKALIYFVLFVGLFQMAILTSGSAIFVLGFLGMWLFAAIDSWRTAQLIRSGVTTDGAEDIIVQRFSGNAKLWGIVLSVIGVSFLLQTLFDIQLLMRFILPALLIGLGAYLLRDFLFNRQKSDPNWNNYSGADISPNLSNRIDERNFGTDDFGVSNDFPTKVRSRTWKNR
jgi:TM2 domain-containing membrane protein YozV